MYRLVAIDLDETLLDTEKRLSDENLRCIELAKRQGCRIVLCSGRAPAAMRRYVNQIGNWDESDLYIALNGCMTIRAVDHAAIETCYFPYKWTSFFIEIARRNKESLNLHLYRDDEYYVERRDETTDVYEARTGTRAQQVEDLNTVADERMLKLVFLAHSSEGVRKFRQEITRTLPEEIKGFISSATKAPFLYELVPASVNKGVAVENAAARFDIAMEESICIGDSYNDIPMIERAGLGVTVANAEESIKEVAHYITERTNDQSAVAEVIRRCILT